MRPQIIAAAVAIDIACGCAGPIDQAKVIDREYREAERIASFHLYRHTCLAAGGAIHIKRSSMTHRRYFREGIPGPMEVFYCE